MKVLGGVKRPKKCPAAWHIRYDAVSLQVCSFRCIVSYESQLLEDFSLCILQKNNCLGLSADIPIRPRVLPMTHFRGQPLTHHQAGQACPCQLPASQSSILFLSVLRSLCKTHSLEQGRPQ